MLRLSRSVAMTSGTVKAAGIAVDKRLLRAVGDSGGRAVTAGVTGIRAGQRLAVT
ncbi:hypothetical protein GCM10025734_61930 [Kitasatospora paranensis]